MAKPLPSTKITILDKEYDEDETIELQLQCEKIKVFPIEITYFVNLQKLSLYYNELKELPGEIGNLTNLQNLLLRNNKLKKRIEELQTILPNCQIYM